MDVDQPPFKGPHEGRREDAHEPGQHHQIGLYRMQMIGKGGIEGLAVCKLAVFEQLKRQGKAARMLKTRRIGPIAHHADHLCRQLS